MSLVCADEGEAHAHGVSIEECAQCLHHDQQQHSLSTTLKYFTNQASTVILTMKYSFTRKIKWWILIEITARHNNNTGFTQLVPRCPGCCYQQRNTPAAILD